MIRVNKDTPLTADNVNTWYRQWQADLSRMQLLCQLFRNKDSNGKPALKHPFAKKLVITSAAAAMGDGVTLSQPEDADAGAKKTFEEIQALFRRQTIMHQDAGVIKDGCIYGRGYELVYMSDDDVPVPKCARYAATNAFVVYDDTVECNSLYGITFSAYKKGDTTYLNFLIYDAVNTFAVNGVPLDTAGAGIAIRELPAGIAHNMGRMPLTEYLNNDEEQGDFEQVIPLMRDRSLIHDLNLKDMREIAKNYLKGRNVTFAGRTDDEKAESMRKAKDLNLIEVVTDDALNGGANDDITMLSKAENYTSIDVFGKDVDSKIYDLSLIPDLSSEQFAGNQSGVALELKLMPFKKLIEAKDVYIERLYRRRLKMYAHALSQRAGYGVIDAADIEITINRNWTDNMLELAQLVATLAATGLYSDEYLTNVMPDADYTIEQGRKATEREGKSKIAADSPDPNNAGLEQYNALLRGMMGDDRA